MKRRQFVATTAAADDRSEPTLTEAEDGEVASAAQSETDATGPKRPLTSLAAISRLSLHALGRNAAFGKSSEWNQFPLRGL